MRKATYREYISSPIWKTKRAERLAFDTGLCAICHEPASSVHHLRYPSEYGKEDIRNDLISVCEPHHRLLDNLERWQRYSQRERLVDPISTTIQIRQEVTHGMARSNLQIDLVCAAPDAQRPDGKSHQQVVQSDEVDFVQANQDRRRL